jgi:urease beta subunit
MTENRLVPGQVMPGAGTIALNPGRERTSLRVENMGDRPVQVGSHFHFADVNGALSFDRAAAAGKRLDIAAGTAVRFEPGVTADVTLVPLAGRRVVAGLQIRPDHVEEGSVDE